MILFIDLLLLKSRTLDRCLYAQRLDNSCELFIIPLISVLQNYSSHRLWLIHFACTSRTRSITSWRSGLWFCRRARRFPRVAVYRCIQRCSRRLHTSPTRHNVQATFHNARAYRAEIDIHVPLFATYIAAPVLPQSVLACRSTGQFRFKWPW